MAPVRERPGPVALTCHVCGRPHVRLASDGAYEGHTQWGRYDLPCHALWPPEEHQ